MVFRNVVSTANVIYERYKKKMTAWTENNDGVNLPEDMDTSHHSGASLPCSHQHTTKGMLPGQCYILHCEDCLTHFEIDAEAWMNHV